MANVIAPVTLGVSRVLGACQGPNGLLQDVHPGLVLDKFARSWDETGAAKFSEDVQRPTIEQVVALSASPPPGLPFGDLVNRWEETTKNALVFTGTTAGPLTLHLARASALENAGICLHPIYGFTYLPGSGLKGLARAFAETVWLLAQPDANKPKAQDTIRRVFGYSDGAGESKSAAGAIIFHDAWPKQWPKLTTDILNSHHADYYANGEPPGDWEDPVPVYFLSVPAGVPFRFALAKRRDDVENDDLELAADWLMGGLTVLGCGAKAATGYGHFTIDPPPGEEPQDATRTWGEVAEKAGRKVFRATLELVTPAFLAGADHRDATACDLRPATLRGLLRWWWRTMHAGFVSAQGLVRLEAVVWGDTTRGGAVRVTVSAKEKVQPQPFDRQQIINRTPLPKPLDNKTSHGLTYHSYGMDERRGGDHVRRFFVAPGAKWDFIFTARAGQLPPASDKGQPTPLPTDVLLEQARAALALLCHFGGVGAKARKGYGSFADLSNFDLDAIKRTAAGFRELCGFRAAFQDHLAQSPALEQLLGPVEVPTGGTNYWLALDQLAAAAQHFAKGYKHRLEKKALGLPRRVGAPTSGTFRAGRRVKDRHASPVLYHFDSVNGQLVARVIAFPAAELPNLADSRKLLQELLDELRDGLGGRFDEYVKGKPSPAGGGVGTPAARTPVAQGPQLREKQKVKARIVPDAKGKGRVFAEAGGRMGIVEGVPVGRELKPGEEVELMVKILGANGKQIVFKWLT